MPNTQTRTALTRCACFVPGRSAGRRRGSEPGSCAARSRAHACSWDRTCWAGVARCRYTAAASPCSCADPVRPHANHKSVRSVCSQRHRVLPLATLTLAPPLHHPHRSWYADSQDTYLEPVASNREQLGVRQRGRLEGDLCDRVGHARLAELVEQGRDQHGRGELKRMYIKNSQVHNLRANTTSRA